MYSRLFRVLGINLIDPTCYLAQKKQESLNVSIEITLRIPDGWVRSITCLVKERGDQLGAVN